MTIYDIRDKVVKLHMYSVMHGHKACAFRSSIMINIKRIKCKRILIKICLNSEKKQRYIGNQARFKSVSKTRYSYGTKMRSYGLKHYKCFKPFQDFL